MIGVPELQYYFFKTVLERELSYNLGVSKTCQGQRLASSETQIDHCRLNFYSSGSRSVIIHVA
jgi:hypothetical protein